MRGKVPLNFLRGDCHQSNTSFTKGLLKKKRLKIAFAGNPNVGKTTLFNLLTGAHLHIGNWPGKTVELAFGRKDFRGYELELVDLPGTYSLSGFTDEEIVARDFIVKEKPDVVVVVTSATTLSRNLYLVLQVLELTKRVVVAVNMIDEIRKLGLKIDFKGLTKELNIPFVPISALYGEGIDELLKAIVDVASGKFQGKEVKYDPQLEKLIEKIQSLVNNKVEGYPPRWVAIRLLERDRDIISLTTIKATEAVQKLRDIHEIIHREFGKDPPLLLVNERYKIIDKIVKKHVKARVFTSILTDKIDRLVLHPILQFVITGLVFILLFWFVFFIGGILEGLITLAFSLLTTRLDNILSSLNVNPLLNSLLLSDSGIVSAIETIIIFIPYIFLFYIAFTFIEHSGLMSRLAFSMDKILRHFGFTGKAFFPLSLSFGCNVIGVQSTRIMEDNKVKILLYLVNSFVPCSARIGVLAILIGVFIDNPLISSVAMFMMILSSMVIVSISGKLISKMIRVKPNPLSIELPPYRFPPTKMTINISWIRTKLIIKRMSLLILLGTVILWIGMNFPPGVGIEESLLGKMGRVLEPLGTPLGLDWRAILALLLGFIAKENTLVVLQSLYGGLSSLPLFFDLPKAFAFIVFYAYYTPCIATVAMIKAESNSWLVTLSSVLLSTLIAYVAAYSVYVIFSIFL